MTPMAGPASSSNRSNWEEEDFWMSEGLSDSLNLSSFLAVPQGGLPDPAKKVCAPDPIACLSGEACLPPPLL